MNMVMIGGMIKRNCSDPDDQGELCWDEQLQAAMLGAFYYGYEAVQILRKPIFSVSDLKPPPSPSFPTPSFPTYLAYVICA